MMILFRKTQGSIFVLNIHVVFTMQVPCLILSIKHQALFYFVDLFCNEVLRYYRTLDQQIIKKKQTNIARFYEENIDTWPAINTREKYIQKLFYRTGCPIISDTCIIYTLNNF